VVARRNPEGVMRARRFVPIPSTARWRSRMTPCRRAHRGARARDWGLVPLRDSDRRDLLHAPHQPVCRSSTGMIISETLPSPTRSAIGCSITPTASPCKALRGERRPLSPTP